MLELNQKVVTANGVKLAKDIAPGDKLFKQDGETTEVLGVKRNRDSKFYTVGVSNKVKINLATDAGIPVSTYAERSRAGGGVKARAAERYENQMIRANNISGQALPRSVIGPGLRFEDGSEAVASTRSKYVPDFSLDEIVKGLVSLYGRIDSKGNCTRYIDINSDIESTVLNILDRRAVEYRKVANGSSGNSRRYNILGWPGNCMENGFEPVLDDKSCYVLSLTGQVSLSRAKLLGIEGKVDKTWVMTDKCDSVDLPNSIDTSIADDIVLGYINATGRPKKGSKNIWSSAGQDTEIADVLHKHGLACTVLEEAGTNGYKFLIHMPSRSGTCEEFKNNYSYRDAANVKRGILMGSLVVRSNSGVVAYVNNSEFVKDVMGDPHHIDSVSGKLVYEMPDTYDGHFHRVPYSLETAMFFDGDPVYTLPKIMDSLETNGLHRENVDISASPVWSGSINSLHKEKGIVSIHRSRDIDLYRVNDIVSSLSDVILSRLPNEKPNANEEQVLMNNTELKKEISSSCSRPSFNVNKPLKYEGASVLPIDPYTLGAWLGDGYFNTGYICGENDEVFNTIENNGYELHPIKNQYSKVNANFSVKKLVNKSSGKTLLHELNDAGYKFADKSRNGGKRIPDEYFNSSYESRLELLRGLMDTDGSSSGEFVSSYPLLAGDVVRLVRELGMTCTSTVKYSSYNYKGVKNTRKTTRIMVHSNECLFHVTRKAKAHNKSDYRRYRGDVHVKWVTTSSEMSGDSVTIITKEPFLAGEGLVPVIALD